MNPYTVLGNLLVLGGFTDAYTTTMLMPVGKVLIPQIIHHDAEWKLQIEGQTDKGIHVTRWRAVTHQEFDQVRIGMAWVDVSLSSEKP